MADHNPLPWFKYDAQFVTDEMDNLSDEHQGAYHRLLRRLWNRGPLPEEELRLRAPESWGAIRGLFAQYGDGLSARWLEEAREGAVQFRASRVAGGVARAKQKLSKKPASAKHKLASASDSSADALSLSLSPSTSDSSSLSQGVQGEAKDERFELLWKTFEGKGAKAKAREYWLRLTEEDRTDIMAKAPAYCASTSGERLTYRKNIEGWINPAERRWEAPIITPRGTAMQVALHSADVPPEAYSES